MIASTMKTAGMLTVPPSPGGPAIDSGSATPKIESKALLVLAPADRDRRDGDAVLEDQVPADDPGDEVAHSRVGVGVGAAGDRDARRQLGVTERGERARHAGEDERQHDRRAGGGDRLADHDEDAGADDRAEAQRGRVAQPDDALEAGALLLRLAHEHVGGLRRERAATLLGWCDRHGPALLRGGGRVITSTGRRERSTSRVVPLPRVRRATGPQVVAPTTIRSASCSSANTRTPRTTGPARCSERTGTPARPIRSATCRAAASAPLASSSRGSVERASSSSPSKLTTATSAPISSARSAAASASHGWSAPALAAATIRFMAAAYPTGRFESHER